MGNEKQYVAMDLESRAKRFFWLALNEETNDIIGTIECGEANEIIQQTIKEELFNCLEIGTVLFILTIKIVGSAPCYYRKCSDVRKSKGS